MKIVVGKEPKETTSVSDVKKSKLYVIILPSSQLCILHRLGYQYSGQNKYGYFHYGFVNLSKPHSAPTFRADRHKDSVRKALNRGNTVMEFENLTELLNWKFKKQE